MLKNTTFFKKLKDIQEQKSEFVEVGFYSDSPKYDDGESVPTVAARNEFGGVGILLGESILIPPRPFMSKSFGDSKGVLYKSLTENQGDIKKSLLNSGQKVQDIIRKNILSWTTPPNSPRTVAFKGFNNPLYHTGNMVNSVRYKIVNKNES